MPRRVASDGWYNGLHGLDPTNPFIIILPGFLVNGVCSTYNCFRPIVLRQGPKEMSLSDSEPLINEVLYSASPLLRSLKCAPTRTATPSLQLLQIWSRSPSATAPRPTLTESEAHRVHKGPMLINNGPTPTPLGQPISSPTSPTSTSSKAHFEVRLLFLLFHTHLS